MVIEERITVNAPPAVIFRFYEAVDAWNSWDPDTKSSSIDGPFKPGTKGVLAPARGRPVAIEVISVDQDRSFTVEGRIPLFSIRFDHELTPRGQSTEVLHRVTFSGLLSFILGPMIGSQVRTGLPKTLASLKAKAEQAALNVNAAAKWCPHSRSSSIS